MCRRYVLGLGLEEWVLLKKRGLEEWDDSSKMKRLVILITKFEGKEVELREGDGRKVGTVKKFYRMKS